MLDLNEIDGFNEKYAKSSLKKLVTKLDELDEEDFFGTEGWRRYFGLED